MTRQIVLDTETTGLEPSQGHRIIEIGCVEMIDRRLTGEHFHVYINPERDIDDGALAVHGISNDFLRDKPVFKEVIQPFLDYLGNSELIIHNAAFDVGFINNELKLAKSRSYPIEKSCAILDTLLLAKEKHPRQKNNLDALCKRYGIDNSHRELHGALLDSEILALVYLAMTGGQEDMFAMEESATNGTTTGFDTASLASPSTNEQLTSRKAYKIIKANDAELARHQKFITANNLTEE
jgi:DNA polymerase-3 subunit epsilon